MDPKDLKAGERYQGKHGDSYEYQEFNGESYVLFGFAGHLHYFDASKVAELEWQSEEAVELDGFLGEPGDGGMKGS
jgi:hypothetical protein